MKSFVTLALAAAVAGTPIPGNGNNYHWHPETQDYLVSVGPRPYYIINNMTDGPLKKKLQSCENKPVSITGFSIGHRGGGTLQFPEETRQSQDAGARMGAGILECDVSFTNDRGLVCRHSLCDLHTTTDILVRPELAKKCTVPFTPANATAPAKALCCTSDITTAEYSTLCGKQDGFNASAKTPQDYQHGTPDWRTELYDTCGKVLTLNEYIDLVNSYPGHRNFTPELKTPPPEVPMPFHGYTQEQYAQDFVDAWVKKNISFDRIWPQSFLYSDILFWLKYDNKFAQQAVYLVEFDTPEDIAAGAKNITVAAAAGVNIIGPSIPMLLSPGGPDNKNIVPSAYAKAVKAAGLDIIAWTFERSGPLATVKSRGEYYFESIANITHYDGQYYEALDVLANQIGIKGLFSDWSATVTYFANCFDLKGPVGGSYH
ncbi:PLC-like phosphodiesterase [Clohesyomyces aquaticus]|uniref:glycerophosphodiester phosphodiesterase n=1 Tax=Clohesyomyces aquaticus TaxID=1231657 RepID=A0A1Y1YY20_9PLEO|nr:PLC-like phosphodiesterase [Clohesyomyces aquaticus]